MQRGTGRWGMQYWGWSLSHRCGFQCDKTLRVEGWGLTKLSKSIPTPPPLPPIPPDNHSQPPYQSLLRLWRHGEIGPTSGDYSCLPSSYSSSSSSSLTPPRTHIFPLTPYIIGQSLPTLLSSWRRPRRRRHPGNTSGRPNQYPSIHHSPITRT